MQLIIVPVFHGSVFFRAVARARNNNYGDALDDFKSFIGKNEMRRIQLFKDNLAQNKDILNDIPEEMISLIRLNIGVFLINLFVFYCNY